MISLVIASAVLLRGALPVESPDGFYLGTLAAQARTLEVGLELRAEGGALSGEYYYFPMGDPIPLHGTIASDGTVRLREGAGRMTGQWSGRLAGGTLAGTWKDAKTGRTWSFRLERSEQASRCFAGPPQPAVAGSTGPITYRMARVPGNAQSPDWQVPLITSFGNRKVMSAVNAHLVSLARHAHCVEPPDDHEFETKVAFVGEDLFSVRVKQGWMCGAAYPTSGADASVTFDLRTGKEIALEELFRADAAGKQVDELLYAYQWAQARSTEPAPPSRDYEVDCLDLFREDTGLYRGTTTFHFTAQGLVVEEELPHALAYCADEVTVPYAALAPVAAPGSALARLAAADQRRPLRYLIRTGTGKEVVFSPR